MTDVESDEFRKARKQRYREAMRAGTEATLEKGRLMDEEHNQRPGDFLRVATGEEAEHVKTTGEILAEAREIAGSIPVEKIIEPVRELATFAAEREILGEIDDSIEEMQEEIESVQAEQVEEAEVETEENTTLSELEQLSAQIAQLERELKEKEKSTD